MEANLKARELVDKYRTHIRICDKYEVLLPSEEVYIAKQCALIAVEEIKEILDFEMGHDQMAIKLSEYYNEVKNEIGDL